eukprot:PITA_06350
MENFLKKDFTFCWNEDCKKSLDVLKENMVTAPILVFPDWKKEFHLHFDASCIVLGVVLTQASEGDLDHPITFASRRLSKVEKNYSTTEHEGLAMVYALRNFRHYLLGGHFKMYTDHSALKYLVNNPVLGGRICRWLLLFQETGRPSWRDEMPLNPQMTLQPFEKWAIDFVGPIQPEGKTGARYIITATDYLTHWVETQPMKECIGMIAMKFLFEYVLTRFGSLKILMRDRGTNFLNEMISALMEEF